MGQQPPDWETQLPPGWYPEPNGVFQRFWDGQQWTQHTAPYAPARPANSEATVTVPVIAGTVAVVLVIVGMICNNQSVSVAQGSGIVWVGAALAIGGAVIALSIPGVRTSIKIVTVIAAIIGVANALYVDHQLNQKRDQIQQIINGQAP